MLGHPHLSRTGCWNTKLGTLQHGSNRLVAHLFLGMADMKKARGNGQRVDTWVLLKTGYNMFVCLVEPLSVGKKGFLRVGLWKKKR